MAPAIKETHSSCHRGLRLGRCAGEAKFTKENEVMVGGLLRQKRQVSSRQGEDKWMKNDKAPTHSALTDYLGYLSPWPQLQRKLTLRSFHLHPHYSKCGPANSISSPWEVVRNARSRLRPRPTEAEAAGHRDPQLTPAHTQAGGAPISNSSLSPYRQYTFLPA